MFAAYFAEPKVPNPQVYDLSKLEDYAYCPFMAAHKDEFQEANVPQQVGVEGHKLIAESIEWGKGDWIAAADYVENELPKSRPDIQPKMLK